MHIRTSPVILATLIALILSPSGSVHAQREWNSWYFGRNVGLVFDSAGVRPIAGPPTLAGRSATAVVYSDPRTGAPLLYTDGKTLWNREHMVVQNGSGLAGSQRASHPALILPHTGDSSRMFVFTSDHSQYPYSTDSFALGISYSMVDMVAESGRGAVIEKNVSLLRPATTHLTGLRLCEDSGYWIAAHEWGTNRFFAWRLSSSGLGAPVITAVGLVHGLPDRSPPWGYGQMAFSPDGTRLALVSNGLGLLELFRFDARTGILSEPIVLLLPHGGIASPNYGVQFSPDSRLMYVTEVLSSSGLATSQITQWDVSAHDRDALVASRTVIETQDPGGDKWYQIHPGPDGRLYLYADDRIDAIEYPNRRGSASGYRRAIVTIPGWLQPGDNRLAGLTNIPVGGVELGTAGAGADVAICAGDSAQLRTTGAVARVTWTPVEGLSCSDCPDPVASPRRTTTYTALLSSAQGCSVVDSVTVIVHPLPGIEIDDVRPICEGDTLLLNARGGVRYRWSSEAELSCTDCTSPLVWPSRSTWYYVDGVDGNGCKGRDSVFIRVTSAVASAGPNVAICSGDSTILVGSDGIAWRWEPASALSCDTCRSPVAFPTTTTLYRLAVTTAEGCEAQAAVTVVVNARPTVRTFGDTTICPGGSATLRAEGGAGYAWQPVDGLSCVDCANPVATPDRTTHYRVRVTDATGCSDTGSVLVTVVGSIAAEAGAGTTICLGDSVRLHVDGGSQWRWEPAGGLSCSDCPSPVASPRASTTYVVDVRSGDGCTARDSVRVTVVQPPVVIARGDTIICGGDEAQLWASGARTYEWRPSVGLACSDCAMTIARPESTTTYTVVGRGEAGCIDSAQVTVTVSPRDVVTASLERGVRVLPGGQATLRLDIDRVILTDSVSVALSWNPNILLFQSVRPDAGLKAAGWTIGSSTPSRGAIALRLVNPQRSRLEAGTIVELDMRAVLGDSLATELPLAVSASGAPCTGIESRAGQVVMDSICGIGYRLIESSGIILRLGAPAPNPVTDISMVELGIPFESTVDLRLVATSGTTARTLINDRLQAGTYQVGIVAADLPSGAYELALRVGERTLRRRLLVKR